MNIIKKLRLMQALIQTLPLLLIITYSDNSTNPLSVAHNTKRSFTVRTKICFNELYLISRQKKMTKRGKILLLIVVLSIPIISIVTLYYFPIFLKAFSNPFYKVLYLDQYSRRYEKYTLLPNVSADIPEGWSIKTTNYQFDSNEYDKSKMITTGNVRVDIYKGASLIADFAVVTDGLGGGGGSTFYKFPDSNPKSVEEFKKSMEDWDPEESGISHKFVEVGEGEYTEITLFGLKLRRVKDKYLVNTEESNDYFSTRIVGTQIFLLPEYFKEHGPRSQVHLYTEGKVKRTYNPPAYLLSIRQECDTICLQSDESDYLILDSILDSMEVH